MPKTALPFESGPYRSVKLDVAIDEQLQVFAQANTGGNLAEAIRLLLGRSLEQQGSLRGFSASLEQRGYSAGFHRGVSEARAAIAEVLNQKWKG